MNVNLTCPFCGELCNMKKDEYVRCKGKPGRQYFHADCFFADQKKNLEARRAAENERVHRSI